MDYPSIGDSQEELYITVALYNKLVSPNDYDRMKLIAINKNALYTFVSSSMTIHLLDGFTLINNVTPAQNLMPIASGDEYATTPYFYFVSTDAFGGNSYYLYELTNYLSSGVAQLNKYEISLAFYFKAPSETSQPISALKLGLPDCRPKSGYNRGGIIHFAFVVKSTYGTSAIKYVRTDEFTQTVDETKYENPNYACSYPSIASFSSSPIDKTTLMGYLLSGDVAPNYYPGMRVVAFDDNMQPTSDILVKAGLDIVDMIGPFAYQRWGDYTGIQRIHDANYPTCWFAGHYANASTQWQTHFAEITCFTTDIETNTLKKDDIWVYPNPVQDDCIIRHNFRSNKTFTISIVNTEGRCVKQFTDYELSSQLKEITLDTKSIKPGFYFINFISKDGDEMYSKKIVIVND